MGARLLVLCAVCTLLVDAGQVLSTLGRRSPPSARRDPTDGTNAPDFKQFELSLRRLRRGPEGPEAVRTVLGYLERVRERPRDAGARSVCLWEPAFQIIATADGGLPCLHAAGFTSHEKDARGTPFLVMRRVSPHALRELINAATAALVEAEAEAGVRARADDGEAGEDAGEDRSVVPPPVTRAVRTGDGDASDADGDSSGGVLGEGDGLDTPERELVQQISSMISGLLSELERSNPFGAPNASDAAGGGNDSFATGRAPSPPIHFRVYRSPSFPGFPPGGGLPFLPGGLGGGVGGGDDEDGEVPQLERKLRAANLPAEADEVATRELKRLRRMSPMHSEFSTLVDYLEWLADLPWTNSSTDVLTIAAARRQLEADHFGMEKVKARMLEYLSVCKLKGDLGKGSILCLLGPPGIGKTSLGRSVADALNREFYRVSLGGVHSEAEIRGHRRTYVGAMPGLIVQALKKCRTNNCVIMLDEIDKLGRNSLNGDPSSALLEVLDPEQNHAFRDHFLNLPFNLSRVLFIATANDISEIPRPLRDRMEVIEMSGYTVQEKAQIATRHLLPKQRRQHGLQEAELDIEPDAVDALIEGYTLEAGVRELDRQIAALCRWVAARAAEAQEALEEAQSEEAPMPVEDLGTAPAAPAAPAEDGAAASDGVAAGGSKGGVADAGVADAGVAASDEWSGGVVTCEDVLTVLGPPKYDGPRDNVHRVSKPGIAVGLAYTPVGGDVLYVEAETMVGKGELVITGKLGEVMVESIKIAQAWVRAHAAELGLQSVGPLLNGTDLHIHFPAGAIPKDGPSAGVTITTAIVSLLTGRLVRPDLAMTGEISLRGLVLPVGGIKEKLIAAHRAGMRSVLIPAKNEKDLRELPPIVLDELNVTLVKDITDVLHYALVPHADTTDTASSPEDDGEGGASGGRRAHSPDPAEAPVPMPFPTPRLGSASAAARGGRGRGRSVLLR